MARGLCQAELSSPRCDYSNRYIVHARIFVRLLHDWQMARIHIDIDEEACASVMARFHLSSKREAVNFALRTMAAEVQSAEEARSLRGSGWNGDLDTIRSGRAAPS